MRHVRMTELAMGDIAPFEAKPAASLDVLSRELALVAANGDPRNRLLSAMQMLGNIRDFLVAPLSPDAERAVDEAIQELMRRERELPAVWRAA